MAQYHTNYGTIARESTSRLLHFISRFFQSAPIKRHKRPLRQKRSLTQSQFVSVIRKSGSTPKTSTFGSHEMNSRATNISRSIYISRLRRAFLLRVHPDRFRTQSNQVRKEQATLVQVLSDRLGEFDFVDFVAPRRQTRCVRLFESLS